MGLPASRDDGQATPLPKGRGQAAGARDRLIPEVGAPTAPIAIRRPEGEGAFSLLIPVRLEN